MKANLGVEEPSVAGGLGVAEGQGAPGVAGP